MNQEEALALLLRNTEEVVTLEEAVALLAKPGPKLRAIWTLSHRAGNHHIPED
jgi:hypothetical protein